MPLPDRLLTLGEAGKVLGEEEKTVRKHVDDGIALYRPWSGLAAHPTNDSP